MDHGRGRTTGHCIRVALPRPDLPLCSRWVRTIGRRLSVAGLQATSVLVVERCCPPAGEEQ
jgi:hypothetical protein